jgi:hypothetical protein
LAGVKIGSSTIEMGFGGFTLGVEINMAFGIFEVTVMPGCDEMTFRKRDAVEVS